MKTARKVLLLALCAVMLVTATITGTLAYLTDTDDVTNTFTVGNVKIYLDEKDTDGSETDTTTEGRDKANEYHLLPGHGYEKDPTVHVEDGSEDCWLFVKVGNGIAQIEAPESTVEPVYAPITKQMATNGWSEVTTGVYAYKNIAKAGESHVVFQNFKINGEVENDTLATYKDAKITVTAYAIQADGFDTAAEAWTAGGAQALAKENATT